MNLTTHRGAPKEYHDEDSGAWYFSVSQVRKMMYDPYVGIPEQVLEAARRRGTLLHHWFWKLLASRANINYQAPPVIEQFAGYCHAMGTWATVNRVTPIAVELKSCNPKLGIAGQGDTLCFYHATQTKVVADLKTGEPNPTDAAQLLAYHTMEEYQDASLLVDLYVREDGTYKEVWIKQRDKLAHWPAFLSALNILKYRSQFEPRR